MGMVTVFVINNNLIHHIKEMGEFGAMVAEAQALFPTMVEESLLVRRGLGRVIAVDHNRGEQFLIIEGLSGRAMSITEIEDVVSGRKRRERQPPARTGSAEESTLRQPTEIALSVDDLKRPIPNKAPKGGA